MGNERKKINLTDIDEDSIVASFKESRQTDGQLRMDRQLLLVRFWLRFLVR